MSVHSYQDIFICAKVFCTSTFSDIHCENITPKQDVQSYNSYTIYDVDTNDVNFERSSDMVKGNRKPNKANDRDNIKFRLTKDINFATSDTIIGGFLTNIADRNVTWYLMTNKSLPLDCISDQSCVSRLETVGGVVNFRKVYLQNRQQYYICAQVQASEVDREFSTEKMDSFSGCSNGFVVDDDPPEPGSVTITGHIDGFVTEPTALTVAWNGFMDVEKYVDIPSGIAGYTFALGR